MLAGVALGGGGAFAVDYDFKNGTYYEFTPLQKVELTDYLNAALTALRKTTNTTDEIKVWITLRNTTTKPWNLGDDIRDLLKKITSLEDRHCSGYGYANLRLEANPDYFPTSQNYYGSPVKNAIRSFRLTGEPVVIESHLTFNSPGSDGDTTPANILYGLTFRGEGCVESGTHVSSSGGYGSTPTPYSNVRVINCTFDHCPLAASFVNGGTTASLGAAAYRFSSKFTGTELTAADEAGVVGSHLYHCTFSGCKGDRGAVFGYRDATGTVITDCTFTNCGGDDEPAEGGAIYCAKTAYRCTFKNCKAKSQGGACWNVYNMVSCLFVACKAKKDGGAIARSSGAKAYKVRIGNCTFDECTADASDGYGVQTSNNGSHVFGCVFCNTTCEKHDPNPVESQSTSDTGVFYDADHHLVPVTDRHSWAYSFSLPDDPLKFDWGFFIGETGKHSYPTFHDRDGEPLQTAGRSAVPGCYRWYTIPQWDEMQERRRPNEWLSMNPLEVTTANDIVDPKDGKISFREACKYLEEHQVAPFSICLDQWPRITFKIPTAEQQVDVTNSVIVLSDKNRGPDDPEFSPYQPVVIDGGAHGVTINNMLPGGKMLEFGVAGVFSNVLFKAGSLTVGENRARASSKVKTPVRFVYETDGYAFSNVVRTVENDRNVNFENCAFAGGTNTADLVDSAVGNVRFTRCSFAVPEGARATGAAKLNVTAGWTSRFECCTFAGFRNASGVIRFVDKGGVLQLLNCTFGSNSDIGADVQISKEGEFGAGHFYALNCIFADGSEKAYAVDGGETKIHCPLTKGSYAPEKKGDLMVNIATGDHGAVFGSELFTHEVRGVPQCAFKPARTSTSRYGQGTYTFEGTDVTMSQPVFDIFGARQMGDRFHSMGSYYADGVEVPSIAVSTCEDVTDAYDDLISLREAVAYGGADDQFLVGTALTPTFDSFLEEDGTVTLTVTGAIRVASGAGYKNYALRIMPGRGQRLVIRSDEGSKNGVFAQESGTKMLQFNRVRFSNCASIEGDGGVLTTEGRYRFDDCFFDGCQAQKGGAICAGPGAEGVLYNVSASRCCAFDSGGVIASEGSLVGANLTFSGNWGADGGSAVLCAGGRTLLASVAFVDNESAQNGAVHVTGGECGVVNGIIIANTTSSGDPNVTSTGVSALNTSYTLCDGTSKGDVFANGGNPVTVCSSNGVEYLYYPLIATGAASGTGAYVFFAGEKKVEDSREAGWLSNVFYSTDPNGRDPKAEALFGDVKNLNTYLEYDMLGNLIVCWDGHKDLPASMGPVPRVPSMAVSNIVTTARDDASTWEGGVSLRAAAEYAISNDLPLVIADGLFSGGKAVFELNRQIDVPKGKTLRIDAGRGRTIELCPAEGKETNRFFNVSGTLSAIGLTFRGGNARSAYESMSLRPSNDEDGGAVWGNGSLAFTNCYFVGNRAKGHGGAIYSHGGLSLANCTFVSNCATNCGGAIYSCRADLSVVNTTFSGNEAGVSGGGGYIFGVGPTNFTSIANSDFVANHAVQVAGGLYLDGGSEDQLVEVRGIDTRILGNTAGKSNDNLFVGEWVRFAVSNVQVGQDDPDRTEEEDPGTEPGGGTVTYPKPPKVKGAYQEFLKTKSTATWTAKPFAGCVFAGWKWVGAGGNAAFNALSENERRNKSLKIRIDEGDKVRPTDVAAVWCRIDEDRIESVDLTARGLSVVTKSYVTASVSGLPSGLRFNAKTLAITGAVKAKDRDYVVKVSVKNASGYTWKQTFTLTVANNAVTGISAGDPTTSGVPVTLSCDETMGTVKGTGVYALVRDKKTGVWSKKVSISASAKKGHVFAGWYADRFFRTPATFWTGSGKSLKEKDYRESSQSITVTGPTCLFARFVEKSAAGDPVTGLAYVGAGYCGTDPSTEIETWYQGVKLPEHGCSFVFTSASLPTVTVSGLPAGVKFDKASQRLTGVPTAASTEKKRYFNIKVTVKNRSLTTSIVKKVEVRPLPRWMVGDFDGVCSGADGNEVGTVAFSISSKGKVSGKALTNGKTSSFSVAALDEVRMAEGKTVYVARPVSKVDGVSQNLEVTLGDGGADGLGCAEIGSLTGRFASAVAVQNGWKLKPSPLPTFPSGRNALSLVTPTGLTLKFGAKGAVKVAGKVNGVSASSSVRVLPLSWEGDGKAKLVAQVCVYVPKAGFCKTYEVVFAVSDGKIEDFCR